MDTSTYDPTTMHRQKKKNTVQLVLMNHKLATDNNTIEGHEHELDDKTEDAHG